MKNTSKQGKGLHPEQGHYALTICCSQLILQHLRLIVPLGFASDLTNIWIFFAPLGWVLHVAVILQSTPST